MIQYIFVTLVVVAAVSAAENARIKESTVRLPVPGTLISQYSRYEFNIY